VGIQVIVNYKKMNTISLDTMVTIAQNDSEGNGANRITVFAYQCLDFMADNRMTFDGCIAVQAADTVDGNSAGTRPCSSRQMNYPSLRLNHTSKLYNNINTLGRACVCTYQISLQQASVESELGTSILDFMHICYSFL
jgi:hypothetical protein